jgi:hypothetical protein
VLSTAFEGDRRGPGIQSVLDVLKQNGIEVESKIMQVSTSLSFQNFFGSESNSHVFNT